MIELDQVDTWPVEILEILADRALKMKHEKELETQSLCDGSYVTRPVFCRVYNKTIEELKNILIRYKILGYHCTKIKNWNNIQSKGLFILRPLKFQEMLIEALENYGIEVDVLQLVEDKFCVFKEDDLFKGREGLLWFVLTKKLIRHRGCSEFFEYFGGEVTRSALWQVKDIVYPVLKKIGIPSVVECRLNISDATGYQIDNMCKQMVKYGIERFALKKDYSLECEMCIKHDLLPDDIMQIREYLFL